MFLYQAFSQGAHSVRFVFFFALIAQWTISGARAEISGTILVGFMPSGGRPISATFAPGRPNELFVVDQSGLIQILDLTTNTFNAQPFLNIQSFVDDTENEQGLLGLAFDPNYASNGYFYVNYTRDPGAGLDRTRIDRFQAINPTSATTVSTGTQSSVLEFNQDFDNHNGGWIGFSPTDDYLYIASGDGGSGDDPNNRGQSKNTRLGKILRVDVTGDDFPSDPIENYSVPSDNPFANDSDPNTLDDIWAYGLRNPWRASFDRQTGDLWIGDVGQGAREEIDFQADGVGGANFGWRLREGDIQTPGSVGGPAPADHVGPVYDYLSFGSGLFTGNSVVGGYVYRGPDPELQGRYFFADSFPEQLWTFEPSNPDGTVQNVESILDPTGSIFTPVSFAEDTNGNLYILNLGGGIYRILTDALVPGDANSDGVVNILDLDALGTNFGLAGGATNAQGDFNGSGSVDLFDLDLLGMNFGETAATYSGPAVSVPEPASLILFLLFTSATLTIQRNP